MKMFAMLVLGSVVFAGAAMAFRTAAPSTVMRSTVAFATASEFAKSEIASNDVSARINSLLSFHFCFYDRLFKLSCLSCYTFTRPLITTMQSIHSPGGCLLQNILSILHPYKGAVQRHEHLRQSNRIGQTR